jgi:hypothetical protein
MRNRVKVGRNNLCPCGTGLKFKACCQGKVNWNGILRSEPDKAVEHLSVRGRNLIFVQKIYEALKFDTDSPPKSLLDFKEAFTPAAVRFINEAIVELWPKTIDIRAVLTASRADVSALYVGEYQPESLLRTVTRHCLYANKIILVDPFVYPLSVKEEFSAIAHPEQFRTQTLRNVHMWFQLLPWIKAGLVEFIRTPADFDRKLNWESMLRQKKKFEENAELRAVLDATVQSKVEKFSERENLRMLVLSAPDRYLSRLFHELKLGTEEYGEKEFLAHIHEMRKRDPFFLEPLGSVEGRTSEFHIVSSGASYDIARLTAALTGSYLVTDLESRWKEIELDREQAGIQQPEWSPLARAFQNANLKYLNTLDLPHALAIRQEGRLESLRSFLRGLWSAAATGNPFAEQNAQYLADELEAAVRSAEEEWKQIDRDLLKWLGGEAAAALLSAGPLIASGQAEFVAAAAITAGTATLTASYMQRRGFQDKFPAAFFMKIKKESRA